MFDIEQLECDLYVMTRFMRLKPEDKIILKLYDPDKANRTFMVWRKDWLERKGLAKPE